MVIFPCTHVYRVQLSTVNLPTIYLTELSYHTPLSWSTRLHFFLSYLFTIVTWYDVNRTHVTNNTLARIMIIFGSSPPSGSTSPLLSVSLLSYLHKPCSILDRIARIGKKIKKINQSNRSYNWAQFV